ncbi:hypothetical protein ACWCQW_54550 [Streptomyces mirabilis]
MAIALLAMFAQMERIYVLERAAGARDAKEARGLPTGRPAKLNARIPAGQRYPFFSQWVLPGPQHLATLATDDGLWS